MHIRLLASSLFVVLAVGPSWAQVPLGTDFTYQGRIQNAGSPASGLHDLRFRLYNAAMGGAQLGGTVCVDNVSVTNGVFTVTLNFGAQFNGDQRFLEIDVRSDTGLDCANATGFVTLGPRQAVTGTPYSLRALSIDYSDVVGPPTCLPLCLPFSGSVTTGVAFQITSTSNSDVASFTINNATSGAEAVDAQSNGGGNTVESGMSGTGRAGFFQVSNASNANDALFATSNGSSTARAFSAMMTGAGSAGAFANTNLSNNSPALSVSSAGSPTGDLGTLNVINTGGGRAAYFENDNAGFYTIRVRNTTGALAAQFVGNVSVTGDLSATGVKPFRIDHPLDPANKYLCHYALESPEVLNIYRGTAKLDAVGQAWIELPAYFASLNRDFDYQLTPIGAGMPDLHVADEIVSNRFRVAGGRPGHKVSWQVTAARNDAYMRRYGAPVEVDKADQRGRYLNPELFGQPASLRVGEASPNAPSPSVKVGASASR